MSEPASPAEAEQLYARLQPHNPAGRYTVTRYKDGDRLWVGGLDPAWSPVSAAEAERLRQIPQDTARRTSPPMFQIVTGTEIQRMLVAAQDQRLAQVGRQLGVDPTLLVRALRGQVPQAAAPAAVPAAADVDMTQLPTPKEITPPGTGDVSTAQLPRRAHRRAAAIPSSTPGVVASGVVPVPDPAT